MKDTYVFPAVFDFADDGISIEFPDLPGCCPCADAGDAEGAFRNAREALGLHLCGLEEDGEEIPAPTSVTALRPEANQTAALIEVFMPSVRARVKESFVKKTVSLPAYLAALADEKGVNCSRVFQDALKSFLHTA